MRVLRLDKKVEFESPNIPDPFFSLHCFLTRVTRVLGTE